MGTAGADRLSGHCKEHVKAPMRKMRTGKTVES